MKTRMIFVAVFGLLAINGFSLGEWTEPVPVAEVNTEYAEWTPFLSFDGLSLYFARGKGPGFYNFRIYEATRSEPYGIFTLVREVLRSSGHVHSPWVSPDNLRMYYYNDMSGQWPMKVSERASVNDPWPPGRDISELNALGGRYQTPSLTADELTIVFSAYGIPGGCGDFDLWMATRPDRFSLFGNVRNLTEVNTAFKEGGQYISPDGLTLYFNSDRNGSGQIFKAIRASLNEPFGNLEHISFLDAPGGGSAHPTLSADGTAFYFIKGVPGGPVDIWVSYLIEEGPYEAAITRIGNAIDEKVNALERINASLDEELAAYEALEELLESGDYGDLRKGDIIRAMQEVHSSIQHQEQSKKALERSIGRLEDALTALGWEPEPPSEPLPVSHWKFDEGSGTTAYDSVGNNHGIIHGATWTTGKINGALSFDGVDDYVDCGDDLSLDSINSVSMWFNPEIKGYLGGIISQFGTNADRWVFTINEVATELCVWSDGSYLISSDTGSISPGDWCHAVITWDGSTGKMYINGVQQSGTTTTSFFNVINPEILSIGIHFYDSIPSTPYGFKGLLDDVRVYDRALSAEEIQHLYERVLMGGP